ncbi:MAG: ISLre2 family transposase, partial [Acetobacteraceae bacterium]|nr:ISLre2 family transposase [Acetobacteraceae bacterium]
MDRVRRVAGILLQLVDVVEALVAEAVGTGLGLEGIEGRVQGAVQRAAAGIMEVVLEGVDHRLMLERGRGLTVVGKRSRTLLTSFGELQVTRRLYRGEGGQGFFLLDRALKVGARGRVSRRLLGLAVELGCAMPFRQAARALGWMAPALSPMGVWKALREAGEACREEMAGRRRRVFEEGELSSGVRRVRELKVEADSVAVRLQRSEDRWGELKLVVAYEGREKVGGERSERYALKNRWVAAAVATGDAMWEEAGVQFGDRWALDQVDKVWVGGDGAAWVKGGLKWFPRSAFVLDRFHLRRRLLEAVGQDPELHHWVSVALAANSLPQTLEVLRAAARVRQGKARKNVEGLMAYLAANWDGIAGLPARGLTGAIEGQVYHQISRRMKRNGARWSLAGADRMARLLAARANGELDRYLHRPLPVPQTAARPVPLAAAVGANPEELWRVGMPALYGPAAGQLWVKVLRE